MTAAVRWALRSASGRTPTGYVRFTPSSLRTGGTPPETVLPDPITVAVTPVPGEPNTGVVVATLDATDAPGYAPESWAWKCEPVGIASAPAPFMFYAPNGSTVDLATVVKVTPATPAPGPGVAGVAVEGGELVVTMTGGAVSRFPLPSASGGLSREEVQGIARTVAQAVVSEYVTTPAPAFPQGSTPLPTSPARRAIILGDSHSDWFWPQSGGVWWWQVAADLAGLTIVDNVAVGGMSTAHALAGWGTDTEHSDAPQIEQAEASDADLAILEFGGNDAASGMSEADFRKNLTEIVQRLQRSGKRVIVTAPPPLFAGADESVRALYARFREVDREVADATGAYYTDAWDKVGTAADGALPARFDSGDKIHMNGTGQLALGLALAPALQAFAGVSEPLDAPRDIRWYGWEFTLGDKNLNLSEIGPDDDLFRGQEITRLTAPPADGEELTIYYNVPGGPGTRWEITYAYQVVSASSGQGGMENTYADWPGGTETKYRDRVRLVGQQGVRRLETTVPDSATESRAFFITLPPASQGLQVLVSKLGVRQLE